MNHALKKKLISNKIDKIVLITNEIHHDYNDTYNQSNRLMYKLEEENWMSNINKKEFKGKTILEIGTGTGFLPLTFIKNKIEFKNYYCSDISQGILDKAKKKINNKKFKFIKLKDKNLPFKKEKFDYIIMNSVLHHLPDINYFYESAYKLLKKKGKLIIGHEPNSKFYKNVITYSSFKIIFNTIKLIGKIKNIHKKEKTLWVEEINKKLIKEKLIKEKLSLKEINHLIDFHTQKGINPFKINKSNFKLLKLKTYNYLSTLDFSYEFKIWNIFRKIYNKVFSIIFPNSGANYFVIYEKR